MMPPLAAQAAGQVEPIRAFDTAEAAVIAAEAG
jgi:hypothetical protein